MSTTGLTEEERRWVVIGFCLAKVLAPALRKVLQTKMTKWYNDYLCQPPIEIDKQTYRRHQNELFPSTLHLNYKNINNNDKALAYDYAVKDPLSLAKLFVKPFMCKFTGFDETMDPSAVLSVICEAEPFINMGAAPYAKTARSEIRNEWAHCNFADWKGKEGKEKFEQCFQNMETLLKSINLSSEVEKKYCNELWRWKDEEFGRLGIIELITRLNKLLQLSERLKSNNNEARLIRLISVQGKDTLRMYFDSRIHPPATLTTTLNDHRERLETLHTEGVITPGQMKLLFPPVGISSSSNYDVSLLFILLRNICGPDPRASTRSWDENPPEDNTSPEADLARIEFYRNEVLNNHYTEVSDHDFNTYWDKISGSLKRIHRDLGAADPTGEIEGLRTSPVGEDSNILYKKLWKMEEQMRMLSEKIDKIHHFIFSFLVPVLVILLSYYTFFTFLQKKPISFQTISNTGFVGREWIFRKLENMTSSNKSRGVLLVADPGWGKSAIMRQLIKSSSSSDVINENIIAYHFCNFNDKRTRDGGRFVRKLSRSIAERVPKFRQIVTKDDDCKNDPVKCFQEAIINPLKELDDTGRRNSYVLIDALDECLEKEESHRSIIIEILHKSIPELPSWVKLIATSRNQAQSIGEIKGVHTLEILVDDKRNKQDLRTYAEQNLQNISAQTGPPWTDEKLINLALESSKGNFLFLETIIKHLQDYPQEINQQPLPASLGDVYSAWFTKRFKKAHLKQFRPLFEVLLASNVPPRLAEIEDILYLYDEHYETREVASELSEFFKSDIDQAPLEFHHQFFAEWLTNQTDGKKGIFIQKWRGHQHIVNFLFYSYLERQTTLTFQKLSELCIHILNAGERRSFENLEKLSSLNVSELRSPWGRCILHDLASKRGATKIIAAVIGHFNSVDILDVIGNTPAMYAVAAGSDENLKILINNGANVIYRVRKPQNLICVPFNIDKLFNRQPPFYMIDALSVASLEGNIKIAELLIERGVDINIAEICGLKPLHFAVIMGHFEIVQLYLAHGVQPDAISLHHATARNHTEIVRLLLKTGIRDTCLPQRTEDCYASVTHLHHCLSETALFAAVSNNNTEMAKLILEYGNASVNCRHGSGRTPLMEAIAQKNIEMVQHLISSGADINAECEISGSLTAFSDMIREGEALRLLYSFENSSDRRQDRMLYPNLYFYPLICSGYRVIDFLFSYDLCEMVSPETFAAVKDDVNFFSTTYGNRISTIPHIDTVLRYVAVCHSVKTFKYLWNSEELRTKFRAVYEDGKTLLHLATSRVYKTKNREKVFAPLAIYCPIPDKVPVHIVDEKRREMMTLLIKILVSKINKKDDHGRTALHYAAAYRLPKILLILLNVGADWSIEDERGETALEFALRENPEHNEPCWSSSGPICFFEFDQTTHYLLQKASIMGCNNKTKKLLGGLIKHRLLISMHGLFRSGLDVECAREHFVRLLEAYISRWHSDLREILKLFETYRINLDVNCGIPFRQSELHLMAYTLEPFSLVRNRRFIANHPKGVDILNECYDKEGYLAIHRAIQGKNDYSFFWFINNGVDFSRKTKSGLSPLVLATYNYVRHPNLRSLKANIIFEELLRKTNEISFHCNSELIDLSPLHVAGSLGMKTLKVIRNKIPHIPLNCINKDGIHPVYLACLQDDEQNELTTFAGPLKYPKREAEYHLIYNKLFDNWPPNDLRKELNYKCLFRCPGFNESLRHKTVIQDHMEVNECATRCRQLTFEANRDFSARFPDLHIQKNISNNFTGSFIEIADHLVELRGFLVTFRSNSRNSTLISALKNLSEKTIKARSCAHNCACFEAMLLLQEKLACISHHSRHNKKEKVGEFVAKRMGWTDTSPEGDVLYRWPFSFLLRKALGIDKEYKYLEILASDWDNDF